MPIANLTLPDGTEIELIHYDICRLFWLAAGWIKYNRTVKDLDKSDDELEFALGLDPSGPHQHIYKATFNDGAAGLKTARVAFEEFTSNRRTNFIGKGFRTLRPPEIDFLQKAFRLVWFRDVDHAAVNRLIKLARRRKADARIPVPLGEGLTPQAYARLLGLKRQPGSQDILRPLEGEYFIFRRIFARPELVISHMTVTLDGEARFPAAFVTIGSHRAMQADATVEGVIYQAAKNASDLFVVGKVVGSAELRTSILRARPKPIKHSQDVPNDLIGIRLGLSRHFREPRGYRIWCSRLRSPPPPDGWISLVDEYDLPLGKNPRLSPQPEFRKKYGTNPHDFFSDHIDGFEYILRWLNNPVFAILHAENDPRLIF